MPTRLSNASTPAWVQAIGTVLALIAVCIPTRRFITQGIQRTKKERHRARGQMDNTTIFPAPTDTDRGRVPVIERSGAIHGEVR